MTGFKILFALLSGVNAWRFLRTRDLWYLGLCLLFASGLIWGLVPPLAFAITITTIAIWILILAVRKRSPRQMMIRALGHPRLRRLTRDERRWRRALSADDRSELELFELIQETRFSLQESRDHIEEKRREEISKAEHAARRAAEDEAEQAIERALEMEDRDLSVFVVPAPTEVKAPPDGPSCWLQLKSIPYPDDDWCYRAPVGFTFWKDDPDLGNPPTSLVVSLFHVIGFPPDEQVPFTGGVPMFWKSCPSGIREVFRNRCLVSGIRMCDDGRQVFDFMIEDKTYVIRTKYLGWVADLALDDDRQRIWVRLSHVLAEIWSVDPESEEDAAPEYEGPERIPAFVYSVPVACLLPWHNPKAFFKSMEELDEGCFET